MSTREESAAKSTFRARPPWASASAMGDKWLELLTILCSVLERSCNLNREP